MGTGPGSRVVPAINTAQVPVSRLFLSVIPAQAGIQYQKRAQHTAQSCCQPAPGG